MDDILIHNKDFDTHMSTLCKVYKYLITNRLKFNLAKLHLGYNRVRFLGHSVNVAGHQPDEEGIKAVMHIDYPNKNVKKIFTINNVL
jgi:hypothetical protein